MRPKDGDQRPDLGRRGLAKVEIPARKESKAFDWRRSVHEISSAAPKQTHLGPTSRDRRAVLTSPPSPRLPVDERRRRREAASWEVRVGVSRLELLRRCPEPRDGERVVEGKAGDPRR